MNALAATASNGPNAALGAVLLAAGVVAYFVPAITGAVRHVRNLGSVIVVNLFLGWTVIGWIVALAMAFRSRAPQEVTLTPPASG